ncbi:MAG: pilus assembly FimT family protein [Christensenellales bacterium]
MKFKRNDGFTVLETMIAIALAVIIFATVLTVFMFSSRSFFSFRNYAEQRTIFNGVKTYLTEQLTYADDVKITPEGQAGYSRLSFEDGKLWKDGALVFPNDYYFGNAVTGDFGKLDADKLTITMTITDPKGNLITDTINIAVVNMQLDDEIEISVSGSKLNHDVIYK